MIGSRALGRFVGALICLVALAGCADSKQEGFRFALSSAPVTLDPRFATDAASSRINRLLYSQLTDFDEQFRVIPGIATWDIISPTRYRFELSTPFARFSDGSILDAADVKATYDAILDPALGSPLRGGLSVIERIEIVDERTLEFHLSVPNVHFPGLLVVGIVPQELATTTGSLARDPVGSGPMTFVEWAGQARLVLERRRDNVRIEFVHVRDPTVRVLKLLRGEVDMMQGDLPPELVAWLKTQGEVQVITGEGTSFAYLGFNMRDPVLEDVRVRRAIAHALDRAGIIRHVLGGAAHSASAILKPDHWAGNPDLSPIKYDPEAARKLLAEAGYGASRPIRLQYKTSSDPFRVRLATIVQAQLGAVGIEVDLQSYDWGTFYGDIKSGRFQMYSLAWIGVKLPDIFRYALHSDSAPPEGANRGRYASERVDRLIEAAEQDPDPRRPVRPLPRAPGAAARRTALCAAMA